MELPISRKAQSWSNKTSKVKLSLSSNFHGGEICIKRKW